ncbi:hypothetical protein K466DRAFT_44555 [Polyporus arcularius HHB13444]|uniref:Uncharacterized protein n=1 Tax=Polyporus arcularius HHB13444 TaxID=1314778 RepID=A0A5C3PLG9_9APHY|nr:hypothetical protein K466DRAFT_44555 [Polyporus arcularius HHB13444]
MSCVVQCCWKIESYNSTGRTVSSPGRVLRPCPPTDTRLTELSAKFATKRPTSAAMHPPHVICGWSLLRAHERRTFSKVPRKSWICGAMEKDFDLANDCVRLQHPAPDAYTWEAMDGCQAFISTWPTSGVTVPLAHYSRVPRWHIDSEHCI